MKKTYIYAVPFRKKEEDFLYRTDFAHFFEISEFFGQFCTLAPIICIQLQLMAWCVRTWTSICSFFDGSLAFIPSDITKISVAKITGCCKTIYETFIDRLIEVFINPLSTAAHWLYQRSRKQIVVLITPKKKSYWDYFTLLIYIHHLHLSSSCLVAHRAFTELFHSSLNKVSTRIFWLWFLILPRS